MPSEITSSVVFWPGRERITVKGESPYGKAPRARRYERETFRCSIVNETDKKKKNYGSERSKLVQETPRFFTVTFNRSEVVSGQGWTRMGPAAFSP